MRFTRWFIALLALAAGVGGVAEPVSAHAMPAAPGATIVRQVDAYGFETCALLPNRSAQCWGQGFTNGDNQPTGTYTELGVGGGGSCGLTAAGAVSCWDLPGGGFSPPPSSGTYTTVVGGYNEDCALNTAGALTCWGLNAVSAAGPFTAVAYGGQGPCAITTAAAIDCLNMVGDYSSPPAGTYTAVTVGDNFACALSTSQAISCWGNNADGQTGAPATGKYLAVSAGFNFACALSTAGQITCWGNNSLGQLNSPKGTFTAIDAGVAGRHACAVAASGYVRCWGSNNFGQLGLAPYLNPGPIPGGLVGAGYFLDLGPPGPISKDGSPPATFTVAGGAIPPGLTLDPLYGLLHGVTAKTGAYPFAVTVANVEGSVTIRYNIIVRGYFLGFQHPIAGSRIPRSARSVLVSFRIGSFNGVAVTARQARGLQLKVTLSRNSNGSHPVARAACSYRTAARDFQCSLRMPRNAALGRYFLTAYQQTGFGYRACPDGKAKSDVNPERIYVRR